MENERDSRCSDVVLAWTKAAAVTHVATMVSFFLSPDAVPITAALSIGFGLNALRLNRNRNTTPTI